MIVLNRRENNFGQSSTPRFYSSSSSSDNSKCRKIVKNYDLYSSLDVVRRKTSEEIDGGATTKSSKTFSTTRNDDNRFSSVSFRSEIGEDVFSGQTRPTHPPTIDRRAFSNRPTTTNLGGCVSISTQSSSTSSSE